MSSLFRSSIIFVLLGLTLGKKQNAVLYDQYNAAGQNVTIPGIYVPDLAAINFDNRAFSVCATGVWLFYEEPNYNPNGSGRVEYSIGRKNYCSNLPTLGGKISSMRFAGQPNDYIIDSFALYQYAYFQGKEEYTFVQLANLDTLQGGHQSIIITGKSNWTVFDQPYFTGNSICLQVADGSDEHNRPSFIADIQKVTNSIPHGTIRSVRKCCESNQSRFVTLTAFDNQKVNVFNNLEA